ncbi:MAG TPA: Ig-like domain-containing protein, partial [Nitrososphaera sp.]|nr:Ig-like domain-containing protein [Nitrososphaera sp.]
MFGSLGRASQPSSRLLAIPLILLVASLATLTGASSAHAEPAIELSPSEGMPGTHVEVTGSGFPFFAVVTLTFDGGNMDTEPATITTDALGRFSATFWIPNSIDEGSYEVVAKSHLPLLPSTSASADFAVTAPNRAPSARSQTISIESSEEVVITLTGSDPDGDNITYSLVDQPQHGAINGFDPDAGTLTYVPETDYDGKDRFTFKVNDGKEDSFLGEVSIKVLATDSGPRMENTQVEVQEDGQVVISLDADDKGSSSLSFKIVDFPAHGTLGEIKPYDHDSAYVTYTPNPDFNGTDSFSAQASDTRFESEVATITVAVTPVQDPPTAQSAQLATRQDETLSVNLTGSDPDGDLLAYFINSPPAHGKLAGSPPNLTYLPSSDYLGWDSFNFRVNDGKVDSAIARIEIKVEE